MPFELLYHPLVVKDVKFLNRNIQQRIAHAIENRLAVAPQSYGKPLSANLAGYWKLRVGDYRVVFKISGQEIWILAVIDRRDVYSEILKRLDWKTLNV